MITYIVPEDGSLEAQEMLYLNVKKSENIQLTMQFYKDKFHVYTWNLLNPVVLSFYAKSLKNQTTYKIEKLKSSSDWDTSSGATGLLLLTLNALDLGTVGSYYCEVVFQPNGSSRIYRTVDMLLDITEDVQT